MFLDGPADKGCIQLHCPNLSKGPQFPDDVPDSWEWLRGKTFGDLLNAETLGSAAALVHNGVPLTRLEAAESSMRAAGAEGGA
jgi:glucose-6-phosphate isomerase